MSEVQMTEQDAKTAWKLGAILIVVCVLIGFLVSYLGADNSIKRATEDGIREDLKYNPDEAEFEITKIKKWGNNEYADVEGVVQAYNGFGAKVKTDFTAELSKGDDGWSLDDYSISSDEELEDALDGIDLE